MYHFWILSNRLDLKRETSFYYSIVKLSGTSFYKTFTIKTLCKMAFAKMAFSKTTFSITFSITTFILNNIQPNDITVGTLNTKNVCHCCFISWLKWPGHRYHSCMRDTNGTAHFKWFYIFNQEILNGEVSLYHWPPVWLVWN